MEKHVVIDFLSLKESHLDFNKSFIKALPLQYKDFKFIGNHSHAKHFNFKDSSILNKDNYIWQIRVLKLFFKLLFSHKKKITVLAFENYIFPLLTLVFFPFFMGKQITLIIHNNITSLALGGVKTAPFKLMVALLNIKLICLTQSGKKKMDSLGFKKSTIFIPHMNYCHLEKERIEIDQGYPINKVNVALLGRHAHLFTMQISSKINLDGLNNIHFHIYSKNIKFPSSPGISVYNKRLSVSDFKSVLSQCDYCLFPKQNGGYRPSGILLDCLSLSSPIIAPFEGHFSDFKHLKIGLFYNSITELSSLILKLNNSPIKRSAYSLNEFKNAQNLTSIERFTAELVNVYSDC